MHKTITILLLLLSPFLLLANGFDDDDKKRRKKRKKGKKTEIRAERQIAVTLDGGWNTVGANGILGSYYVTPRIGVDLGFGTGLKGSKVGVRGKYMLSSKNFAPFVGLGLSGKLSANEGFVSNETITDPNTGFETFVTAEWDTKRTLYVQPTVGFEYMSNGGFVIGLATGYSFFTAKPYEFTSEFGEGTATETAIRAVLGNGIILSMNIGYAF